MPKNQMKPNENLTSDIDKTKGNDEEESIASLSPEEYSQLLQQCQHEYKIAKDYIDPQRQKWLRRLKLYNNQRRDEEAIGDPLMFTVFQTILASLYHDTLLTEWTPRKEEDEGVADNLNKLSQYDYGLMKKSMIDYDSYWDTLFFGNSYISMSDFDRRDMYMCPVPEVIDPTTFLYDPEATSVNGDMWGRNSAKFLGREISLTLNDMNANPAYFNTEKIKASSSSNGDSLIKEAKRARSDASNTNYNEQEKPIGDNQKFDIVEWRTHFRGKKVIVAVANEFKTIIRFQEKGDVRDFWDIVQRKLFPVAHEWNGGSVPDYTEDKQRAKSILENITLKSAKLELFPMYIYDQNRIQNRNDLNFEFNKAIPVKGQVGDNIIRPLHKSSPNIQLANYIMEQMDASAQRALATPEIQQGSISQEKRTLGELELMSAKVDTRYSLSQKIFGWSEMEFWMIWYKLYKKHFKATIDEKVIRLEGAFGIKWRPLTRENIIGKADPDVQIKSKYVTEQTRMRQRVELTQFIQLAGQDPNTNMRYGIKKIAKLQGLEKDEIDRLFPPTIDEMQAERENLMINEDDIDNLTVRAIDNHQVHLEYHSKAKETKARQAHIEAHREALLMKRESPELFPQNQGEGMLPGQERNIDPQSQPQGLLEKLAPNQSSAVNPNNNQ